VIDFTDEAAEALAGHVREHVRAFNDRDLDALLAGFTEDALWVTGTSAAHGRAELAELFAGAMEGLLPTLTVETLLAGADGDSRGGKVACQLIEVLTVGGRKRTDSIAAFFTLRDGLIASAKVYREGNAEVEA
jgi:ketosteroid isomerase-like protein